MKKLVPTIAAPPRSFKNKDLVTVVVPVFNREQLIGQTLESIALQSYKLIELIIVDDGSTDNSAAIAIEFIKKNKINGVVYTIKNCGPEQARDYGCIRANGEYVAPLDSDDIWEKDFLEKMVSILNKYPDIGIAFSDFYIFFDKKNETIKKSDTLTLFKKSKLMKLENGFFLFSDNLFPYLLQEQPVFIGSMLIRKSFYNQAGLFSHQVKDKKALSVEWEFILRAAKKTAFIYCDYPLLRIRKHDGNISGTVHKQVEGTINVLEIVLRHYDLRMNERIIATQQIAKRSYEVGMYYFSRIALRKSRTWFLKSLKNMPQFKILLFYCLTYCPKSLIEDIYDLKRKFFNKCGDH